MTALYNRWLFLIQALVFLTALMKRLISWCQDYLQISYGHHLLWLYLARRSYTQWEVRADRWRRIRIFCIMIIQVRILSHSNKYQGADLEVFVREMHPFPVSLYDTYHALRHIFYGRRTELVLPTWIPKIPSLLRLCLAHHLPLAPKKLCKEVLYALDFCPRLRRKCAVPVFTRKFMRRN